MSKTDTAKCSCTDSQKLKSILDALDKVNLSLVTNGLRCIAYIESHEGNSQR